MRGPGLRQGSLWPVHMSRQWGSMTRTNSIKDSKELELPKLLGLFAGIRALKRLQPAIVHAQHFTQCRAQGWGTRGECPPRPPLWLYAAHTSHSTALAPACTQAHKQCKVPRVQVCADQVRSAAGDHVAGRARARRQPREPGGHRQAAAQHRRGPSRGEVQESQVDQRQGAHNSTEPRSAYKPLSAQRRAAGAGWVVTCRRVQQQGAAGLYSGWHQCGL